MTFFVLWFLCPQVLSKSSQIIILVLKKYLLRQAKKCRRTCAKCTDSDSDCPAHARSICSNYKFCYIDYSVSGQWLPWSDCADAHADPGRRCPHMPEDIFLQGAAHLMWQLGESIKGWLLHLLLD